LDAIDESDPGGKFAAVLGILFTSVAVGCCSCSILTVICLEKSLHERWEKLEPGVGVASRNIEMHSWVV
jgi:hypothetical protein